VVGAGAVFLFYPSSLTDVIGIVILAAFMAKKLVERHRETAASRAYAD
jgi:hypothetical protein